jgi:hypothetical protein
MIISYNNKPFVQFFVLEDGGWLLASCFRFLAKYHRFATEGEEENGEDECPPWKKQRLDSDEERLDLGYSKTWADFSALPILETEIVDIFIGRSELEHFTWRSRAFGPQFLGNSILLQMRDLALLKMTGWNCCMSFALL